MLGSACSETRLHFHHTPQHILQTCSKGSVRLIRRDLRSMQKVPVTATEKVNDRSAKHGCSRRAGDSQSQRFLEKSKTKLRGASTPPIIYPLTCHFRQLGLKDGLPPAASSVLENTYRLGILESFGARCGS